MRVTTRSAKTFRTGVALAALLAPAAVAQPTQVAQIEEIIVTAQKREQRAVDVPIALTAVSAEFLDNLGIRELDDLSNFVPGLQVQLQSPNNPGFVIRGLTSDTGSSQQEARVSVFVDGVAASRARGAVSELYDLDRVEVLKGPQGTLFGRGAQIGAVSVVTAKPVLGEVQVRGRVAFGDYSQRTYEAAANVPVGDKAAFRIAGISRKRDGYIENLAGGEALNGVGVQALRGSVLVEPTEDLTLTAIVNVQEDDYTGTSFKNRVFAPQGGTTSPFTAAQLNRGEELGVKRDLFNATLQGEYRVNDSLSLTSITGYREFNSFEEFDADGSQAYLLEFAEDAQGEQWSQELRVNFELGDRFEGFVGASYFYEDNFQRVPLRTNERSLALQSVPAVGALAGPIILPNGTVNPGIPALPIAPGVNLPLRTLATAEFTNFGENTAYDVFADGTFRVTDALSLTAGLRYTREELKSGYVQSVDQTPSLFANLFPNVPRRDAEEEFDSVVGRFVASYQVTDDALAYASVARGRRPAVVQVTGTTPRQILENEIVWSYEVGGKGVFLDGMLQVEGAAYYYDYSNFQTAVAIPTPPFSITDDAGEARALGFEASVVARPMDGLTLFANYGYVDAEFKDEDADGRPQALAGNTFRLTPKHVASIGGTATVPLGAGSMEGFLTPSFTWKSRVYFEDANQPGIEQGGYGLLNLRAGVQDADGTWKATIFVENALDRDYLIDAGNTGASFGLPTYIAGTPRFYGVELSFTF